MAGQGAGPQQSSVVLVVPVDGGVARELFPVSSPQTLDPDVSWLPDGRALFVRKYLDPRQQASEFWLVLLSPAQFLTLPTGDLNAETCEWIVERVRAQGGRIV